MQWNPNGPPNTGETAYRLFAGATLLLLVTGLTFAGLLWTGTGIPMESALEVERLPWSDRALAPLPGVHPPYAIERQDGEVFRWQSTMRLHYASLAAVVLSFVSLLWFGRVRPAAEAVAACGVERAWVVTAPLAERETPRAALWLSARSDVSYDRGVVGLIPDANSGQPASVVFRGARYTNAGAAASNVRFAQDLVLAAEVDDRVPWGDFAHALDAMGEHVRFVR